MAVLIGSTVKADDLATDAEVEAVRAILAGRVAKPSSFVFSGGADTQVTAAYNAPQEVASLTIPDPGWQYTLVVIGVVIVRTGSSANQRIDLSLRMGTITGTEILHVTGTQVAASTYQQPMVGTAWPRDGGKLSGPSTIKLGAGMFPGGTGLFLNSANDPGHFITCIALPA